MEVYLRAISRWFFLVSGVPSMETVPDVGSSSQSTQRMSVDLPEPDGPMITTFSPRLTVRLMSLRTCRSPKYLLRPRISIISAHGQHPFPLSQPPHAVRTARFVGSL